MVYQINRNNKNILSKKKPSKVVISVACLLNHTVTKDFCRGGGGRGQIKKILNYFLILRSCKSVNFFIIY